MDDSSKPKYCVEWQEAVSQSYGYGQYYPRREFFDDYAKALGFYLRRKDEGYKGVEFYKLELQKVVKKKHGFFHLRNNRV